MKVQGLDEDEVRIREIIGYTDFGVRYQTRGWGSTIDLRGFRDVKYVDVFVEARWNRSNVEFTVYSNNSQLTILSAEIMRYRR
ncbi:hypothetical protein D3C87_1673270 [compost metagenome]